MKVNIFRNEALENLENSDNQINKLENISTVDKASFALLFVLIITVFFCLFFLKIEISIKGNGIFLFEGGFNYNFINIQEGTLSELKIKIGQKINKGDQIGRITPTSLSSEIDNLIIQKKQLMEEQNRIKVANKTLDSKNENYVHAYKSTIKKSIKEYKKYQDFLKSNLKNEQKLFRDGYSTKNNIFKIKAEVLEIQNKIDKFNTDLEQINYDTESKKDYSEHRMHAIEESILQLDHLIDIKKIVLEKSSIIKSPVSGIVSEMFFSLGSVIPSHQTLGTISTGENINEHQVFSYIPLYEAKKIKPGMEVKIYPSTTKYEVHGAIYGIVSEISNMPLSLEAISHRIGNSHLAREFSSISPIQVTIDLKKNFDGNDKFKWTNNKEHNFTIAEGTAVEVSIIEKIVPPYKLLVPFIKRSLDVEG